MTHGITPADAGKTPRFRFPSGCMWDHPRGCGENHYTDGVDIALAGITPADAGKTHS